MQRTTYMLIICGIMTKYYQPQYGVKCNLGKVKTQDSAGSCTPSLILLDSGGLGHLHWLVLIYRAFLEVTIICSCCLCMPQLQPFLLPALPFLWMSFKGQISADLSIDLSFSLVMVVAAHMVVMATIWAGLQLPQFDQAPSSQPDCLLMGSKDRGVQL